jgi:hypothetical protein
MPNPAHAAWMLAPFVPAYLAQAEQRERTGDLEAAAALLAKCLDAAEACGDAAAAGAASHRLGLLCAVQGRWREAAEHQAAYAQRSKKVGQGLRWDWVGRERSGCVASDVGAVLQHAATTCLLSSARPTEVRMPPLSSSHTGLPHGCQPPAPLSAAPRPRFCMP